MREKLVLSWSGGKDSALALYELQKTSDFEMYALLTTFVQGYDRVSMHGVRRALLEEQAKCLGIPLEQLFLPQRSSNEEYVGAFKEALTGSRKAGVSAVAFGDIFLEDVRSFREEQILKEAEMRGVFPLWKKDTVELAHSFISLGFKAVTTCVDASALGQEFVGREFDEEFLSGLPSSVDPCGENGEFHSFVYDGPIFNKKVPYTLGEIVFRDNRFHYCDLIPVK